MRNPHPEARHGRARRRSAALAGCGGGGDDAAAGGDGDTLTLWHYEGADSAMGIAWDAGHQDLRGGDRRHGRVRGEAASSRSGRPPARCSTPTRRPTSWSTTRATRRRPPRQPGPAHRHLRRGRRVRLGRQARARRCRPRPSTTKTASWAPAPGTASRTTASSSASTTTRTRSPRQGIEIPTTYDEFDRRAWTRSSRQGITPLAEAGAEYPLGQLWYQLALSQADRQCVNDYQLYENPVDWQGEEVTYATETLKDYVDKGYIASDVSGSRPRTPASAFINGTAPIFVLGLAGGTAASSTEIDRLRLGPSAFPGADLSPRLVGQPVGRAGERRRTRSSPTSSSTSRCAPRSRPSSATTAACPSPPTRPTSPTRRARADRRPSTALNEPTACRSTPTGPPPTFYDDLVAELQGLVNGTQDADRRPTPASASSTTKASRTSADPS